jgi:hypothetical protein
LPKRIAAFWLLASTAECFNTLQSRQRVDTRISVRKDTKIVFGSEPQNEMASDEEEDFAKDAELRAAYVEKVLLKQDAEFKEERRKKKWGDFADAKTKEDILKVEESIKAKIALENKRKAALAQMSGVSMEVLDPQDSLSEDNGNIQIKAGSSSLWYNKVDEDLQAEWEALEKGNEHVKRDDGEEEAAATVEVNGKIVSKDTLQGVRVGSAGGWSLEVFPGDFVVHRKFGIGRFERSCFRKYTLEFHGPL